MNNINLRHADIELSAAPVPGDEDVWYWLLRIGGEIVTEDYSDSLESALEAMKRAFIEWRIQRIIPDVYPRKKTEDN